MLSAVRHPNAQDSVQSSDCHKVGPQGCQLLKKYEVDSKMKNYHTVAFNLLIVFKGAWQDTR